MDYVFIYNIIKKVHGSVKCDIDLLLKYDWKSLDRLYLNMSCISDDSWRKLVQHGDRFANVRFLNISTLICL